MIERIAVLAFDGISAFHLSVPYTVFGEDRQDLGIPRYPISICAVEPGLIRTSMGFEMRVSAGLEAMRSAEMVIIPSWNGIRRPSPASLIEALRDAHGRGAKIVGLCLGAFVLADAGMLDGRTGTTHWAWAPLFAERFPLVKVDPQVLYIDHGDVVTSAGTAAGLDCCLHLLRQQLGAEMASRLARRLVIPPHRQGSQAQYVEQPVSGHGGTDRLARTLEWARGRLDQPLDVETLAKQAAMSRRTFTRHFQKATGTTVVQWLTAQRLHLAQRLLETSRAAIEEIAAKSGFGSALSLRLSFAKAFHTTPARYRREFGGRSADSQS